MNSVLIINIFKVWRLKHVLIRYLNLQISSGSYIPWKHRVYFLFLNQVLLFSRSVAAQDSHRFSSVTWRIFLDMSRFTADVSFFFTGISEKGDVKSPETSLLCEPTAVEEATPETDRPLQQVKPTQTWTWMHLGETWPAVCVCVYRLRRLSWTLVTQCLCVERCRNCTVHSASCELLSLSCSQNHFKLHDNGSFLGFFNVQ